MWDQGWGDDPPKGYFRAILERVHNPSFRRVDISCVVVSLFLEYQVLYYTTGADLGLILTDFLNEGPREKASRGAPGNFFLIFKVPKVPFLGFLSNARKLEKENICPDYFPESSIIVILLLKMFIVKNLTDFRKTVETGVDPRLHQTYICLTDVLTCLLNLILSAVSIHTPKISRQSFIYVTFGDEQTVHLTLSLKKVYVWSSIL